MGPKSNKNSQSEATPRRSPRLSGIQQLRALSGRQLNCTFGVAKDFKSPVHLMSKIPPKTAITPKNIKRKSDLAVTPLREEFSISTDMVVKPPDPSPEFNFCNLPDDIRTKYSEKRKISNLYDWQKDCLSNQQLLRGSNCIISLPTGAGKTLIAEILMLREAVIKKRSSILVLPYVAIVQEKINSLAFFEEDFGIRIEEYAATKGRIPPIKRRKGCSIYVATIEKANMLINSLIETENLDSIGLLVIDELHMVGDGSRGIVLEHQLTKFQFKGSGQIVGMSATLSNMPDLARFLAAFVYSTNFRPVELKEFVKLGNSMYKIEEGKLEWDADLPENKLEKYDPDGIIQLLQGVIPNKSVIIFCPTKKNCENVALLIAKYVPQALRNRRKEDKEKLIESIKEDGDGNIEDDMIYCLRSGIAYHHSGLTHDERKHIEAAYTEGILSVICATSTLAAGVNLPARRVIIKAPVVGMNPLGKAQYLQMIGRAGRAGFDSKGDSITIVRRGQEERHFREMLNLPMVACNSSMSNAETLMAFILDIVVLKLAKNVEEIMQVLRFSLLLAQKPYGEVLETVSKTVKTLITTKMLQYDENDSLRCTLLGNSTFDANLDPSEAQALEENLKKSLAHGIVFSSHFHLLFTIAPHDMCCEVNWDKFHDEYKKLSSGEKKLLESIGYAEIVILQALFHRTRLKPGDAPMRLYIGLILQKIWNQESHSVVAQTFGVDRGWLQSVLQSSIARAAAISRFSEASCWFKKQSNLWPFRLLLPELVQRLSDCSRTELIPLLAIENVKRGRAHQLYSSGFKTVAAVAKADFTDLLNKVEHLRKFQAIKIINSARALLRDQLDEKLEEIEAIGIDLKDIPYF